MFINFVNKDDLVTETEKDIADLVLNYIKSRRNLLEEVPITLNNAVNPDIKKENEEKAKNKEGKAKVEKEKDDEKESSKEEESKEDDKGKYLII